MDRKYFEQLLKFYEKEYLDKRVDSKVSAEEK